ncbi:acetylserotonin O-methyltransferase [Sagmatias obliquidens]|uniref:acetylserotonin O-methyltransferase n=1 Tax=Sagmatias obliquidens TaxID=3371155 RepID=UPI000F440FC5|nr:acetylserotonin O-methyltransferase [Lagenorhynchus obliquidens]
MDTGGGLWAFSIGEFWYRRPWTHHLLSVNVTLLGNPALADARSLPIACASLVLKRIEAESGFCRCPEVLFAACELGAFDLLAEVPEALGSAAVAARLGVSSRGTELLLDACVSLKLLQVEVRREKAVYENTELASTYLARASPKSQQDMLLYAARTTYLGWGHLAARLSGGSGPVAKVCMSLYPGSQVTVFDIPDVVQMAKRHFSFPEDERIGLCEASTGDDDVR